MTITKERLLKTQHWRETYGADSNVMLPAEEAEELARIALASLEAEPIGAFHIADQQVSGTTDYIKDGEWPIDNGVIEVYAAPPASVVPDERAAFNAWNNEDNLPIAGVGAKNAAWLAWQARASLCGNSALNVPPERPADSSNGDDIEAWFDEGWNACRAAMLQGDEPVSETYNLPELIEGMEVSIDVSTCDADAGNRYFGTVTEVSELYTAKNGYILLVQDAKPNFDVNGNTPVQSPIYHGYRPECECSGCKATARICAELNNEEAEIFADGYNAAMQSFGNSERLNQAPVKQPSSDEVIGWLRSDYNSDDKRDPNAPLFMLGSNNPSETWGVKYMPLTGNSPVTPDGWISCSERMPDNDESKPIAIFTGNCLGQGMFVATYDDDGFFDYWEGMEIIGVTHWMPLPAPPQQ